MLEYEVYKAFARTEGTHIITPKFKNKVDYTKWKKIVVFGFWLGDQTNGVKMAAIVLRISITTAWRYLRQIRKKAKL